MRKPIWKYINLVMDTLPLQEPIYEFGAYQVEDCSQDSDLRPALAGKEYYGCDMRAGPGVDIVLNLHNIDLPDSCAGTVFLMDTLEHVEYPHRALEEIHRILKPDGMVVMSSVLDFFIHNTPHDYWRFTPDGFNSLLKPFQHSHVGYYGRDAFPHSLVGIGFKGEPPPLEEYLQRYTQWAIRQTNFVLQVEIRMMQEALANLDQHGLSSHE